MWMKCGWYVDDMCAIFGWYLNDLWVISGWYVDDMWVIFGWYVDDMLIGLVTFWFLKKKIVSLRKRRGKSENVRFLKTVVF